MPNGEMIQKLAALNNRDEFLSLNWQGTLEDHLARAAKDPRILRSAYQRVYDMILSYGVEEYVDAKKKVVHYRFFDDPQDHARDAVFGLDIPLMKFVQVIHAAARQLGPERRILLLHGPVGASKSTIVRLLKKGLERYTRTEDGALFTHGWKTEGGVEWCPMNEEPLHLIPSEWRAQALKDLGIDASGNRYATELDLCPFCRFHYGQKMLQHGGDWAKVMADVVVKRLSFSEQDRVGIGTFQPKDEKNQDSTELTGDINYRKIAIYGSDSDPRAFNFDGELCVANRGVIEFVEVLKLDVAFLYDLLGATQEHKIKPKKFAQTDIDMVIIGHTNEPEYRKLQNNEYMEALRDRTIKIDMPYITRVSEEIKIYEKEFNKTRVKDVHIAPHTLEVAAMWAVMTRLEEPKKHQMTLVQKMKLYNGKVIPGFTEDNVKELRKESAREGMEGISPRYVQDKLSNALVSEKVRSTLNPFVVMNELENGLRHHSLVASEDLRNRFRELLVLARQEYEDMVKNEVQQAISADEKSIERLCANYVDNVKAYTQKEKIKNRFTGQYEEPDERLMRAIEEKMAIPANRKDDFRKELLNYIGALAIDGKKFDYKSNDRLRRALELKLFEDQKDTIKLTSIVSDVIDRETQEKIDIVKNRLIKNFGYNEESATDVLQFVASIFARGDVMEEK
jgi:serine protein kinase